jgi:glycosyltransferase involved in cell wall biosynthesis
MDQAQSVLIPEPKGAARTMPMRLLFLIAQFDTGGVQFQLYLRLKYLDPTQFRCHVCVLTSGNSYLVDKIRELGVTVDFLHIDEEKSQYRRVARIQAAISRFSPDIVDSLLGWDNTYGNLAATLERVPLIIAELQNERASVRQSYSRSFRLFEWAGLRFFCHRIVCCSGGVHASYRGIFPSFEQSSVVIHDAIDVTADSRKSSVEARKALGIDPGALVVGTIGRLMEQKDHETFIRTARHVCATHPETQFLIGGYGHLLDHLEGLISEFGLRSNVRILGEVTDVYSFYNMVDIFILTSRWEGFPVVLMEAMAAGKPVVSTAVGGINEMIDQGACGFLCPAGDAQAIAEAIGTLLDNPSLRLSCGRRAQEKVLGSFSIQRLIENWQTLYRVGPLRDHSQSDAGGTCPGTRTDSEAAKAPLGGLGPSLQTKRLLTLRLCPLDRFKLLISELVRIFPNSGIDVLCQHGVVETLARQLPAVRTIPYGEGKFTFSRLGLRALLRLCRTGYDLAVIPYNTPAGLGYWRSELLGLLAGRGRILAYEAWSGQVQAGGVRTAKWFAKRFIRALAEGPARAMAFGWILARGVMSGAAHSRRNPRHQGELT